MWYNWFKLKYNISFNNYDQFELLKKLHFHQSDILLKLESWKDLFERLDLLIGNLVNISKKYSEPYNLSYKSANKSCLDLSKFYQFQLCRPRLTTSFSESQKICVLRS